MRIPLVVAAMAALFCTSTLQAQMEAPEFPQNPATWLNSPPLSKKMLEGKAAVLYFFEEG